MKKKDFIIWCDTSNMLFPQKLALIESPAWTEEQ